MDRHQKEISGSSPKAQNSPNPEEDKVNSVHSHDDYADGPSESVRFDLAETRPRRETSAPASASRNAQPVKKSHKRADSEQNPAIHLSRDAMRPRSRTIGIADLDEQILEEVIAGEKDGLAAILEEECEEGPHEVSITHLRTPGDYQEFALVDNDKQIVKKENRHNPKHSMPEEEKIMWKAGDGRLTAVTLTPPKKSLSNKKLAAPRVASTGEDYNPSIFEVIQDGSPKSKKHKGAPSKLATVNGATTAKRSPESDTASTYQTPPSSPRQGYKAMNRTSRASSNASVGQITGRLADSSINGEKDDMTHSPQLPQRNGPGGTPNGSPVKKIASPGRRKNTNG